MRQPLPVQRPRGLLSRTFHAYAQSLRRSVLSGDQIVYPAHGQRPRPEGRHDFDFLHGRYRVRNVRLRDRLCDCTDWDEFEAANDCRPILDHGGNFDEFATDWRGGFRGMTLRLYDPTQRQWSLYWASGDDGVLEPPVVGHFEHGTGIFFGRARHHGREVCVRFRWHDIHPDSAHWEQAFSDDGGRHWETNWHMYFTRMRA